MNAISRRRLLQWGALSLAACFRPAAAQSDGCTLSIGTYGMKDLPLEKALEIIAATGFDGVEIAARPGWDGEPGQMPPERRKAVKELLNRKRLRLTALMEHLFPATDDAQHVKDLERLRNVIDLGNSLSPEAPPLVQTVFGSGEWESEKERLRDRLADWSRIATGSGAVLAIKPHRGGVMSQPAEALWLINELGNPPSLRMVYDYSHYAFRDLSVEDTVALSLPYIAHVAVKDAVETGGKVAFKLPGETGNFDYARLLRLLYDGGYRGDICCEVSGMVWNEPGYDPVWTVKTCYDAMAMAFEAAGVPRSGKQH